ncbi:MAG: TraB/GumN family protein [Pseudomonadota bacterium]
MRLIKLFYAAVMLLLSISSSVASAQASAPVCTDPAATMLWEVKGAELDKTGVSIKLFGSLHVGKPEFYPLAELIENAFRSADHLVFEVDPTSATDPQTAILMQTRGMLPAGQTLQSVVSPEAYATLKEVLASIGMPAAGVNNLKPWLVALMLTNIQVNALGYSALDGLEMYFTTRKSTQSDILELETIEQQLAMLDSLNPDIFLGYSLADLQEGAAELDNMVQAWRCADQDKLSAFLFDDFTDTQNVPAAEQAMLKELHQRLFAERNVVMANGIEQFIRSGEGAYFVVVGSGHLLGQGSVVELLRERGYQVEPLKLPSR